MGLTGGVYAFWRTRTTDALYGVSGNPVRTGQTSGAHFVGWEPELVVTYAFDAHPSFQAMAAYLVPGSFLNQSTETGDAGPVTCGAGHLRGLYRNPHVLNFGPTE